MEQQETWLVTSQRPALLALLAAAINEFTIRGRYDCDEPDIADRLRETNEAIHRIAEHLRDLCRPDEAMTFSRAGGVVEQLELLAPAALNRIYEMAAKT